MAYWTRDQYEEAILDVMDATGSTRYSTLHLRQSFDGVYGRAWRRLLNANATYRVAGRTVNQDTNGQVMLSALNGGAADTLERTYKVLAAAQGQVRYTETTVMDNPLALAGGPIGQQQNTYQVENDAVLFLPVQSGVAMTVWVNFLPQIPSALSAGSALVKWPQDYEMILVYETAARLLAKGYAETGGTIWFQQLADNLWPDCLADVMRPTIRPTSVAAADNPDDWGA